MILWKRIKDAMLRNPKQMICEDQAKMSYEEMVIYAELFAKNLQGQKCCAILCGSEMATAMAILSCFAAEVTAVPLSFKYGEKHCGKALEIIGPTSVITDVQGKLCIIPMENAAYKEPPKHPALIMCTSGTTGLPKGVMLSEQNILANIRDISAYFDIDQKDRILIARPLYHVAVLTGELLVSLCKGVEICFYSDVFNPRILLNLIQEKQITVFGGTPTMLRMMPKFMRMDSQTTLKKIVISGECMGMNIRKQVKEAFQTSDIYFVYGLSEACPRVSYLPPHLFEKYTDCVGITLDSVSLKIMRRDGTCAKNGEEGVLWIKGPNVMLGYYNDMPQTVKVLKKGWLCTGDIAVINEQGLLCVKGRSDDLIIRAGINIYPQEIEEVLKKDPRVFEALVYPIQNSYMGTQIAMKIVGEFTSIDQVKTLCQDLLPDFQVPSFIELVDELPVNGSGKVIRHWKAGVM